MVSLRTGSILAVTLLTTSSLFCMQEKQPKIISEEQKEHEQRMKVADESSLKSPSKVVCLYKTVRVPANMASASLMTKQQQENVSALLKKSVELKEILDTLQGFLLSRDQDWEKKKDKLLGYREAALQARTLATLTKDSNSVPLRWVGERLARNSQTILDIVNEILVNEILEAETLKAVASLFA